MEFSILSVLDLEFLTVTIIIAEEFSSIDTHGFVLQKAFQHDTAIAVAISLFYCCSQLGAVRGGGSGLSSWCILINKTFQCKIVNISLPINFNICLGAQKNRLIETLVLSTHNICFG